MGSRSACGRRPGSASPIRGQPGGFYSSGPTSPSTKIRALARQRHRITAFRTPNAAPGEPAVGLAAPDCVLALYPMPEGDSLSLWGGEHPRARCHILGLGVPNVDEAAKTLAAAGIGVVRRTATSVVVNPAATGEVPLVLIDELLPGDPRQLAPVSQATEGSSVGSHPAVPPYGT
jgi:hypothetical protein